MPRAPRIEIPGGTFHITAGGKKGEPIFRDREDSLKFLSLFETICSDHNWDCFAYCLMPGEYQLAIRTGEPSLAKGMQRLNGRFAGWINSKRGTVGQLLGGRYSAVVVDPENWLLPLVRLGALAPVRGGLAESAERWRWSSYRTLVEEAPRQVPKFLARDEVLGLVADDRASARSDLRDFVENGLTEDKSDVEALEVLVGHNQVLGSRNFARQVERQAGLTIPLASTEPQAIERFRETFTPTARAIAAAYWTGGWRQKDIAEAFDINISTVSRAGAKYRDEFDK